jgi:hypothetical protein
MGPTLASGARPAQRVDGATGIGDGEGATRRWVADSLGTGEVPAPQPAVVADAVVVCLPGVVWPQGHAIGFEVFPVSWAILTASRKAQCECKRMNSVR